MQYYKTDQPNSSYFDPRHIHQVIFCKVDLDTCLTAMILGIVPFDNRIARVVGKAPADALSDIHTLCLECGGSGQVLRGNFDHHDTLLTLPPACHQALQYTGFRGYLLERLVNYVCAVDVGPYPVLPFPSLASLFSGMLLVEKDPLTGFSRGIEMLKILQAENLNPFEVMPLHKQWRLYLDAKLDNNQKLADNINNATYHISDTKLKVGFLSSRHIGGAGSLYSRSCQVSLMHNPSFGTPPIVKYTLGGVNKPVNHLLARFNDMEPGWGGTSYIIGSPFTGSGLQPESVLKVVLRYV